MKEKVKMCKNCKWLAREGNGLFCINFECHDRVALQTRCKYFEPNENYDTHVKYNVHNN